VLKYDINGGFISAFNTGFSSFTFYKINSDEYFFYNGNNISKTHHQLIRYNAKEGKIVATYFPIDEHMATYFYVLTTNNFGTKQHPFFSSYAPSDTIYGFTETHDFYPKYVIDFDKHRVPSSFYKSRYSDIRDFSIEAAKRGYIYTYNNFCENSYLCAFSFYADNHNYWVLYNKQTGQTRTINSIIDDFHSNAPIDITFDNEPMMIDNNYLYFFLQAEQSEEENMVLVRCKFKNKSI
jgi:hypothetical protein